MEEDGRVGCLLFVARLGSYSTFEMQQLQNQVLTWCLIDNLNSMAVVLYPAFTYNAGKLHMEEATATKLLSSGNHNLDYSFSLCFKERRDTRDERPLPTISFRVAAAGMPFAVSYQVGLNQI